MMENFTESQFQKFSEFIYQTLGIYTSHSKKEMLEVKLNKLATQAGFGSLDKYFDFLVSNNHSEHWSCFVDTITIHKTDFFREDYHFQFIQNKIHEIHSNNPRINQNSEIRVWSAACSTGEEPYTIAMVLKECLLPGIDIKILATDISEKVIDKAIKGVFLCNKEVQMDPYYVNRYFKKTDDNCYSVKQEIKDLVTFRTFNLMDDFPFKNTFDIIFCRNVMIYFDDVTQERLIRKFYDVLTKGGLLLIGHSESLINKQYKFKYIQPTIYLKTE